MSTAFPRTIAVGVFTCLLGSSVTYAQDPTYEEPENQLDITPEPSSSESSSSGGSIIGRPGEGYGTGMTVSGMFQLASVENTFGIGISGIFGYPILPEGFLPSVNESFHIEAGLITNIAFIDSEFISDGVYISPVVGARWDFHFLESLTAYAALRTGVAIGASVFGSDLYLDASVGGFWRFTKPIALRFEVGGGVVGAGASVGVALFF